MIADSSTNFLYLSNLLPLKYPAFFERFEKKLKDCNIPFQFLPGTKDIWAVDFMPVQISKDTFVQFTYDPDYLQPKIHRKTISDVDSICQAIKLDTVKSKIIVDGGNVVRASDKVIMCDKVFHENKTSPEKELITQLKELFQVDKLFFVPWDKKNDFIGHADGMVRFIDNETVLINDYSKENELYQRAFRMSLHNAGLDWVVLPYDPRPDSSLSAEGIYINYLQMEQAVIMPTFNNKYDEDALKVLEQVFKGKTIVTVESNDVAKQGGILNCISWNIAI